MFYLAPKSPVWVLYENQNLISPPAGDASEYPTGCDLGGAIQIYYLIK